jgi:hypothetical protein
MAAGEKWERHCREAHPRRRVRKCVRNLMGTAIMCCIGDCDWSVGVKRG